jgi:hypothetical protein
MRVTDDDLRRVLLETAPASRAGCPGSDALAAAAAGGPPSPEREAVIEHLGRCRDCAQDLLALRPFEPWARATAGRLQGTGRVRWPAWAAAAAVAVIGLGLLLPWRHPHPVVRTQEGPAIRSLLPESSSLPRDRCVLRWSDAGQGARYGVSVLSKDLQPLAAADGLEHPDYAVPPGVLQAVPPGGEIVWSVETRWPDGRRLASPAFVTRLD